MWHQHIMNLKSCTLVLPSMATCFQEALCPGIEVLPAVQMQDKQQAILFFSFLCPSQERRKYFHFW